jgi:hypothetical protein
LITWSHGSDWPPDAGEKGSQRARAELNNNPDFRALLVELEAKFGAHDGSQSESKRAISHPKVLKLEEV